MKCHLCVNYIELQTDPGNCDYVIVSGARRKEERWDPGDSAQVLPTSESQYGPVPPVSPRDPCPGDPSRFQWLPVGPGIRTSAGTWGQRPGPAQQCPQSLPVPPVSHSNGVPAAPEQRERLAVDPMFRLEHGVTDRGVLERATPTLTRLQEAQDAWKDDFGLNSRLRRRFRVSREVRDPQIFTRGAPGPPNTRWGTPGPQKA